MMHDKLKGKLSHLHSYHFQKNSTQYRIAYEVLEEDKVIFHYDSSNTREFL